MKVVSEMTPRGLLVLWTRMAAMANEVNATRRPTAAKGPRGIKRRAKRRRSEAKLLRDRRRGFRAFGEREKMGIEAYAAREKRYAQDRKRRAKAAA